MPAARFWEFGEGDVYLGGIEAAPEDLARVAVAAYCIVYGDDWLIVPLRLKHRGKGARERCRWERCRCSLIRGKGAGVR